MFLLYQNVCAFGYRKHSAHASFLFNVTPTNLSWYYGMPAVCFSNGRIPANLLLVTYQPRLQMICYTPVAKCYFTSTSLQTRLLITAANTLTSWPMASESLISSLRCLPHDPRPRLRTFQRPLSLLTAKHFRNMIDLIANLLHLPIFPFLWRTALNPLQQTGRQSNTNGYFCPYGN
jgi:hypothetical protein